MSNVNPFKAALHAYSSPPPAADSLPSVPTAAPTTTTSSTNAEQVGGDSASNPWAAALQQLDAQPAPMGRAIVAASHVDSEPTASDDAPSRATQSLLNKVLNQQLAAVESQYTNDVVQELETLYLREDGADGKKRKTWDEFNLSVRSDYPIESNRFGSARMDFSCSYFYRFPFQESALTRCARRVALRLSFSHSSISTAGTLEGRERDGAESVGNGEDGRVRHHYATTN